MPRRGITMIELLVVITIIGVSLGLLLPAVVGGRAAAARTQCQNNQKQIALAMLIYHDEFETFPAGLSTLRRADGRGIDAHWGWMPWMLRMMEQSSLASGMQYDLPPSAPENETVRITKLTTMLCPSDGESEPVTIRVATSGSGTKAIRVAKASYVASFGTGDPLDPAQVRRGDGVFFLDSAIGLVHLEDGTSTTFLIGERSRDSGPATWAWAMGDRGAALVLGSTGKDRGPNARPATPYQFSSRHEGGAYFSFADGGVRFIRSDIGEAIYHALATRAGGEYSGDEW